MDVFYFEKMLYIIHIVKYFRVFSQIVKIKLQQLQASCFQKKNKLKNLRSEFLFVLQ